MTSAKTGSVSGSQAEASEGNVQLFYNTPSTQCNNVYKMYKLIACVEGDNDQRNKS